MLRLRPSWLQLDDRDLYWHAERSEKRQNVDENAPSLAETPLAFFSDSSLGSPASSSGIFSSTVHSAPRSDPISGLELAAILSKEGVPRNSTEFWDRVLAATGTPSRTQRILSGSAHLVQPPEAWHSSLRSSIASIRNAGDETQEIREASSWQEENAGFDNDLQQMLNDQTATLSTPVRPLELVSIDEPITSPIIRRRSRWSRIFRRRSKRVSRYQSGSDSVLPGRFDGGGDSAETGEIDSSSSTGGPQNITAQSNQSAPSLLRHRIPDMFYHGLPTIRLISTEPNTPNTTAGPLEISRRTDIQVDVAPRYMHGALPFRPSKETTLKRYDEVGYHRGDVSPVHSEIGTDGTMSPLSAQLHTDESIERDSLSDIEEIRSPDEISSPQLPIYSTFQKGALASSSARHPWTSPVKPESPADDPSQRRSPDDAESSARRPTTQDSLHNYRGNFDLKYTLPALPFSATPRGPPFELTWPPNTSPPRRDASQRRVTVTPPGRGDSWMARSPTREDTASIRTLYERRAASHTVRFPSNLNDSPETPPAGAPARGSRVPRTPSLAVYNDSLPPARQPQTPAEIARSRSIRPSSRLFSGAFDAVSNPFNTAPRRMRSARSAIRKHSHNRAITPLNLFPSATPSRHTSGNGSGSSIAARFASMRASPSRATTAAARRNTQAENFGSVTTEERAWRRERGREMGMGREERERQRER